MKKQAAFAAKLSFSREKVASLTPADLDQVQGGLGDSPYASRLSSDNNFTCCACTAWTVQVEEAN